MLAGTPVSRNRSGGIRTHVPLVPNQARCQPALHSVQTEAGIEPAMSGFAARRRTTWLLGRRNRKARRPRIVWLGLLSICLNAYTMRSLPRRSSGSLSCLLGQNRDDNDLSSIVLTVYTPLAACQADSRRLRSDRSERHDGPAGRGRGRDGLAAPVVPICQPAPLPGRRGRVGNIATEADTDGAPQREAIRPRPATGSRLDRADEKRKILI